MPTGSLRSDLRAIRRALYFDPDAQKPHQAIERHVERLSTISELMLLPMEMACAKAPNKQFLDLSPLGWSDQAAEYINIYAEALGEEKLKLWRDDQRTIERYCRTKHGSIDAFIKSPEFGASPEAMWAHLSGRLCHFAHGRLSEKEQSAFRKELRDGLRQLSDAPIKLHPATGKDRGLFFDPENIPGQKYYAMRFAFPCADFPDYDPYEVVFLEEDD